LFAGRGKNTVRREKSWKTESGAGFGNDMQTVDPLEARQWFTRRGPMAWAISIAVFIASFFLLTLALDGFLAFIIAVIATGCLFFFYLDRRAMGIECPSCGKYILTNTPWICGFCGAKNFRVDEFPFVGRCGNKECGAEPKAYQCHHCEKLVFLTPDRQKFNFAKCVNVPDRSKPVKKDPVAGKISKQDAELHDLKHELDVTIIKGNIKEAKARIEPPKMKGLEDKYRGMVKDEDDARKLKASIDEECKNDPVERAKRHAIVDSLMRDMLP
jgi:hypothetical protein